MFPNGDGGEFGIPNCGAFDGCFYAWERVKGGGLQFEFAVLLVSPSVKFANGVTVGNDHCFVKLFEMCVVDSDDVHAAHLDVVFKEVGIDALPDLKAKGVCKIAGDYDVVGGRIFAEGWQSPLDE